jgi:ADP-ribosylglycohydrolase
MSKGRDGRGDASLPTPLERARISLDGLSAGDAFGDCFFGNPDQVAELIQRRVVPAAPWAYTDDTEMALSIFANLREYSRIEQDALAQSFAFRYNPQRGYGSSMHGLLEWIRLGVSWQVAAPKLFGGSGSFGNGAAMRIAPLGAYFADDLDQVVAQAETAAVVTHTHRDAVAGAIAVAVAAAWAW